MKLIFTLAAHFQVFQMGRIYVIALLVFSFSFSSFAQQKNKGENVESMWYGNATIWKADMMAQLNATPADFKTFLQFYQTEWISDRSAFFRNAFADKLPQDSINVFYARMRTKYIALYNSFLSIKKDYPSTITSHINELKANDYRPSGTCPPACNNLDFENGNLSGWTACYAVNNSSSSTDFSTTTYTCSGPLGTVTKSAYDPNTTSYQVAIMSGSGVDPIAGGAIPIVSPTGGKYSARIGDSTGTNYGVAELSNQFTVSASAPILTLQCAVVLENPNHTFIQQPWFQIQVLDQSGNAISSCGQYFVVSGKGNSGFHSVYYALDGDSVYYRPWTTIYVPLYKYVGQCVTVIFKAADCAAGGHFGYAYVDASCGNSGIIASAPAYCGQSNMTLTAPLGLSSYSWSGPSIVGPKNQQTITISGGGAYKVIASGTSPGCIDTLNITVPTVSGPVPKPSFTADTVCLGTATHFTNTSGTGTKFYWDYYNNGKIDDSLKNPNFTFPAPGIYPVKLFENTSSGCTSDTIINVFVPDNVATITGPTYACSKSLPITLTASPGLKYLWAPSGGTTSSINVTPSGITTYTVKVTTGSCIATGTLVVTPSTTPSATISSSTNVTCNGACNGKATVSAVGGVTPYTYDWHTSPVDFTQSVTNLCAGKDTVFVTDAHGCTTFTITTITQPATIITINPKVKNVTCSGLANGSASVTVSGGNTPYTYLWSPSGGTTSASTPLAAGQYTITVTDKTAICASTVIDITQPYPLTISTNMVLPDCGKADGILSVATAGGTGSYKYVWSPTGGSNDSAKNLNPGNYTVKVTDSLGCTVSSPTLTLNSSGAIVTLTINQVLCNGTNSGSAIAMLNGGTAPYTYKWSSGATTDTAKNLAAGNYTVTVIDKVGCQATSTFIMTQPTLLTASTTSKPALCFNTNTGSATVTPSGGTGPYTYIWAPSGGSVATALGLKANTYTVTVTDAHGCKVTPLIKVTQRSQMRDSITTSAMEACYGQCKGGATVGVKNGTKPYTYLWSPSGGSLANAGSLCAGNYKVVVLDSAKCRDSALITITQPAPLTAGITPTPTTCNGVCNGYAIVTAGGGTSPYTYIWSPSGGATPTASSLCAGSYQVTVTDKNNCNNTATTLVTQPMAITINATANPSSGSNDGSATVTVTGGTGPYTYSWSPMGGTNATADSLTAGTYAISVSDAHGCLAFDNVTIPLESSTLHIYNALTPNGDGKDDYWKIEGIELLPNNHVEIYNRWGIEVWKGTGYNNAIVSFTGIDEQGQLLPSGTYYYVLNVNGTSYKGWIQLLR